MFWQRRSRGGRRNANGVSVPVSKVGYIGTNILSRGDTTRSILEFAGSQYGEFVTAWEPTGDFEIEVEFATGASGAWSALVGNETENTVYVQFSNIDQLSVSTGLAVTIDGASVSNGDDVSAYLDGKVHTLIATGNNKTIHQIGRQGVGAYFNGNILSVKLTDTAGGDNRTYTLDDGRIDYNWSGEFILGSEIVSNGTFDTNVDGWAAGTGMTIEHDTSVFANGGIKVVKGATNEVGATYTLTGLTVGQRYKVECNAFAPSTNGCSNAAVIAATNTPQAGTIESAQVTAEDAVQALDMAFTADATTATVYLLVLDRGVAWGTVGDTAYFDDISVKQMPATTIILNNFTSDHVAEYTYRTSIAHDDGTVAAAWVGGELVTNGGFDTDSDWTKSAGATIATGLLTLDSASDVYVYQDIMTIGSRYLVACNYAAQADTTGLYVGSNGGSGTGIIELSAVAGTYAATGIVAASAARFTFRDADGCESTVDSVSAKHLLEIA